MKNLSLYFLITFNLTFLVRPTCLSAQSFEPGWSGAGIVPLSTFIDPANWITGVPHPELGDLSHVTAAGDTLTLNWTFGTGNRYKWAQCYLYYNQAISLADFDLFGFNLKGKPSSGVVGFELKFEDGTHQAVIQWDGLAGLDRWAERISAPKKQFSNTASMDWSHVKVISFAVYAQASGQYTGSDHGTVSIYQLIGTKMADWERATSREFINPADYTDVKENALNAIVNRQQSNGLLMTWEEDGSSWLYGQGLALKALSIEGTWTSRTPTNSFAEAAEKLALFLAANQQPEGYWPRAWNSVSGSIKVLKEDDGTVWMGDFPWTITGLQAYYKKSGDARVIPAVKLGLAFLDDLITPEGQLFTINPVSGVKPAVTSCEAYAAVILGLSESGDASRANNLFNYISIHGWDSELNCWREGTLSDRIVLFGNTWMSYYQFQNEEEQKGLDALTLAGKVLYTSGNGVSFGMDGIVPLALWNEGTLSYIADGGPGSVSLFDELVKYIHSDGTVSHYNENLGSIGGIWAVDWHSLDGTSWLYFTAAGISPFDILPGNPAEIKEDPFSKHEHHFIISALPNNDLVIRSVKQFHKELNINVIDIDGRILTKAGFPANSQEVKVSLPVNNDHSEFILVQISGAGVKECYPVFLK